MTEQEIESSEAIEEEQDTILMSGDLARLSSQINATDLEVVVGTGHLASGEPVLVPFLNCRIEGAFEREAEETEHSVLLTLDNVAFVIMRLATELEDKFDALESIASGRLKPTAEHLAMAASWLDLAALASGRVASRFRALAHASTSAKTESLSD